MSSTRELLATGSASQPASSAPEALGAARELLATDGSSAVVPLSPEDAHAVPPPVDTGPSPWILLPVSLLGVGLFSGSTAMVIHEVRTRAQQQERVRA
jgi:hypothetical protein